MAGMPSVNNRQDSGIMIEPTGQLRLHIQNPADEKIFLITDAIWQAAANRHPEVAKRLVVSNGRTEAEFHAAIGSADLLISWTGVVRALFPTNAPKLKIIFCTSAGLDRLAPFDLLPPGCALLNNSGVHGPKAGEWGLMAILMLANHMPLFATQQRERRYEKHFSRVVAGQSLLALGVGDMAGHTLDYARRLGMKVIGVRNRVATHPHCDEVVGLAQLDAVLPRADYLLITCPLTPQTRGLLDRRRLALLKPSAGLINMARGAIVDQDALCDQLDRGALGGAVLDVFTTEPLPPDSRVWTTRNLVMAPHVSSDDPESYNPRSLDIFFRNFGMWLDGKPMPNMIDVKTGY